MRLDDAVTYFIEGWGKEDPSPNTVETYETQLKWLCGFVASRRRVFLADLTPDLLRAAMAAKIASHDARHKDGKSAAKALAFAARRLVRWLAAQGVPVADPLTTVKPPRPPERIQPRLHPQEFDALEDGILRRLVQVSTRAPRTMVARDLALIHLLAETGLRASEICAMEVRSVDFEAGAVLVLRGKGDKERALSILDAEDARGGVALQLLADWIAERATLRGAARHSMLWTSIKGRPLNDNTLRRVLERISADAGLPEKRPPHAFRRMNFTEHYRAHPTAIRVLADRMGWSPRSSHMISVYTRGAEIDFARLTPVSSVVGRWRQGGPNVPVTNDRTWPITNGGVGSSGGQRVRPGRSVPLAETSEPGRLPNSPKRVGTLNISQ